MRISTLYYMVCLHVLFGVFISHIVFQQHKPTTHRNCVASESSINWYTDQWSLKTLCNWYFIKTQSCIANTSCNPLCSHSPSTPQLSTVTTQNRATACSVPRCTDEVWTYMWHRSLHRLLGNVKVKFLICGNT